MVFAIKSIGKASAKEGSEDGGGNHGKRIFESSSSSIIMPSKKILRASGGHDRNDLASSQATRVAVSEYEDYGIVSMQKLEDFPLYIPDRPANRLHKCTAECNSIESEESIREHLKVVSSPLILPLVLGWQREIKKTKAVYVTPCGKKVRTRLELSRYLIDVHSRLPFSAFCFDKKVDPLRVLRIKSGKVRYNFEDLAEGLLEPYGRILVFNCYESRGPPKFTYVRKTLISPKAKAFVESRKSARRLEGCGCQGHCTKECLCFIAEKEDVEKSESIIYGMPCKETRLLECSSVCSCSETCGNRMTTSTIPFPLILYYYPDKGWGVRALCDIPVGTFVTLYAGKMILSSDVNAEECDDDTYLVELGLWRSDEDAQGEGDYLSIDGSKYGNVGRFFNHSCDPNMFAQVVHREFYDMWIYDVAFFTRRLIIAGEELTWDYNYKVGSIQGRQINCFCKAKSCKGRVL